MTLTVVALVGCEEDEPVAAAEAPVLAYISASNQIRADSGYVLTYPDGTVDRGTYVVRDLATDETRYGEGRTTTPEVTVPQ